RPSIGAANYAAPIDEAFTERPPLGRPPRDARARSDQFRNAPLGDWQPGVPGAGQASQQLAQVPTTPCLSVQCIASFFVLHFVTPLPFVMQHVTKPGFPQVECAAHFFTAPL